MSWTKKEIEICKKLKELGLGWGTFEKRKPRKGDWYLRGNKPCLLEDINITIANIGTDFTDICWLPTTDDCLEELEKREGFPRLEQSYGGKYICSLFNPNKGIMSSVEASTRCLACLQALLKVLEGEKKCVS